MTKTTLLCLGLGLLYWSACDVPAPEQPFLSSLSVKRGDPIYTTYAAAMERASFLLDEGYALRCFDPEAPLSFHTDTGGELSLGFRMGTQWVYRTADYARAPEIVASYPDLVQWVAEPFEGLEVQGFFLVQGSRAALLDLRMTNETKGALSVEVLPLFEHTLRPFHTWEVEDKRQVAFQHESYPDGWTISQGLPHIDSIQNLFSLSEAADSVLVFQSDHPTGAVPFPVFRDSTASLELSGRSFSSSGERLMHRIAIQAFFEGSAEVLLTEDSPLKGLPQPGIDLDGFRRTELSWLPGAKEGKAMRFMAFDLRTGEGTTIRDLAGRKRVDLTLGQPDFLPPVQHLQWTGQGMEVLSWSRLEGADRYAVYRRKYPDAVYERIGYTRDTFWQAPSSAHLEGFLVLGLDEGAQPGMHSREVLNRSQYAIGDFLEGKPTPDPASVLSGMGFVKRVVLAPGESHTLGITRLVAPHPAPMDSLRAAQQALAVLDRTPFVAANEQLFAAVPKLAHASRDVQLLYYSAFNMLRQVFYPAEGKSSYNYYVFSREPTWGWGHGGQVFHESLTMLSYVLMDPTSAMNSQRVYAERQYDNGYINYRTGSWLDEKIEYKGELTSSAPWYNWINAELFKSTRDTAFLREMYASGKAFYQFYTQNRDKDGDGLCEWGGHAVLESVRDAAVAVWDEVGWPAEFEGVDVNSMLVMEARSLAFMARALGLDAEAKSWETDYLHRSTLIRKTFWDESTGFFYNADKADNDFSYQKPNDLKRREIIGFLPLWAGIADSLTAKKVIETYLLDPAEFWRPYGVPTLSARDPYYNAKGYWNGPVWVEWNLFIVQALLQYGYQEEARVLVDRLAAGMIAQLKANQNLWEFYSPDEAWAGYHKTYIWAAIINRMLLDAYGEAN